MNFRVDCACGIPVRVTEASAGGSVQCLCGRSVPVPELRELRVRAGLPPYNVSPEVLIEHLLADGELPPDNHCVRCATPTEGRVHARAVCERTFSPRRSKMVAFLLMLLSPVLAIIYLRDRVQDREEPHGRDKIYRLPLPVCAGCRDNLHGRHALEEALRVFAVYDQLLEKFPDADLRLEEA